MKNRIGVNPINLRIEVIDKPSVEAELALFYEKIKIIFAKPIAM
ncbi:hypothetical protein [Paenibacillus sp. TSA_86.1]